MGEFTFANVLLFKTFAVYINEIGQNAVDRGGGAHAAELRDHLGCHARRARDRPRPRGAGGRRTLMAQVERLRGSARASAAARCCARLDSRWARANWCACSAPRGCGKTTLLRILAGFERPDAGRVVVDGEDVTRSARRTGAAMGMVFQAYSLFPNMTARQNVRFGPRVRGSRSAASRRSGRAALLDLVGLSAHAEKYPHQLSGGQQQRVALARALAVRAARAAARRAALGARCEGARAVARGDPPHPARDRRHHGVRHARPGGGAVDLRPRRGDERGPAIRQLDTPSRIYREPADAFVARFIGAASVLCRHGRGAGGALRRRGAAGRRRVGAGARAPRSRCSCGPSTCASPRPPSRAHSRARLRS